MPKEETKLRDPTKATNHLIGTLGEKSLHAALKQWYTQPGDLLEKMVDGFHIDIVRRKLLIEIQTCNFSSIKSKLTSLTEKHRLRLLYPIAQEKWVVRLTGDGITQLGRRKSPKKGHLFQLFEELVSIPGLIKTRNFSLEVLLIREEETRRGDGLGSRQRKGWSISDRRLLEVVSSHVFEKPAEFLTLIPPSLPQPFSTQDLTECVNQPRWLAQKAAYCLRKMGTIEVVGKKGNSILYATKRSDASHNTDSNTGSRNKAARSI